MSFLNLEDDEIYELLNKRSFEEVIKLMKDEWASYGVVREHDDGLIEFVTGGWSENEILIDYVTDFRCKHRSHYVGFIVGGAHFFQPNHDGVWFDIIAEKRDD